MHGIREWRNGGGFVSVKRLQKDVIYTHDEAAKIVELFEDVLSKYNIRVPSDEDHERDEDNMTGLYGSTYGNLLDDVEGEIVSILSRYDGDNTEIINGVFSGCY